MAWPRPRPQGVSHCPLLTFLSYTDFLFSSCVRYGQVGGANLTMWSGAPRCPQASAEVLQSGGLWFLANWGPKMRPYRINDVREGFWAPTCPKFGEGPLGVSLRRFTIGPFVWGPKFMGPPINIWAPAHWKATSVHKGSIDCHSPLIIWLSHMNSKAYNEAWPRFHTN